MQFRRAWGDLACLLSAVALVPKLFLSATLPMYTRQSIINAFQFDASALSFVTAADSLPRQNLFISLRPIQNRSSPFDSIVEGLELRSQSVAQLLALPLSIIYMDSKPKCVQLYHYLQKQLPREAAEIIGVYHSDCQESTKNRVYEKVFQGIKRIVIATECLGMVSLFY